MSNWKQNTSTQSNLRSIIAVAKSAFLAGVIGSVLAAAPSGASSAVAGELMREKCSGDVRIVRNYDDGPNARGVVVLKRDHTGFSAPTPDFRVNTKNGFIRWWCKSTRGNWLDLGTRTVREFHAGIKCDYDFYGRPRNCRPVFRLRLGSSVKNGFTPERSRCSSRSKTISARLGPNRRLWIACR